MTISLEDSAKGQAALNALQRAVAKALDKKQRLGQYAVVWQDDKPMIIKGELDSLNPLTLTGKEDDSFQSR
ncbi:MAG: hypothetical protein NTX45_15085 [Proteobacteria bacterium]|nr:hypothetical protein [Pseudomonadota bacterium]